MNNETASLKRTIPIRVECSEGSQGQQTPDKFFLSDQLIEIVDIVDRWVGADLRYFKVRAHDRDLYILKYDIMAHQWELTLFAKEDYLIGRQFDPAYSMEIGRDL